MAAARSRAGAQGPDLTAPAVRLLGRPDCHLCHLMHDVAEGVLQEFGLALTEVDIGGDAALVARYGLDIPVLMLGEREVARHRIAPEVLRERLIGLGLR